MEFDPRDQDIIRLLTKLKDINVEYPESVLMARRQSFLNRMAEIELDPGGGTTGKTAQPPHVPPVTGLLEVVLLVVIAIEASMMAYFYREKLADFFQTFTTTTNLSIEAVTAAPVISTSLPVQEVSASPASDSTAVTASPADITGTPVPGMLSANSSNTPEVNSLSSTPDPNGNNGHHYGQTPKPERTKENNGNNGNNGKPPKDKPTKDKPKPTKAK